MFSFSFLLWATTADGNVNISTEVWKCFGYFTTDFWTFWFTKSKRKVVNLIISNNSVLSKLFHSSSESSSIYSSECRFTLCAASEHSLFSIYSQKQNMSDYKFRQLIES